MIGWLEQEMGYQQFDRLSEVQRDNLAESITSSMVNSVDKWKNTLLHHVALNGEYKAAFALLRHSTCLATTFNGAYHTPLHGAAGNGHTEVANLLLQRGADVNALNTMGYTPLSAALHNKHESTARVLMDWGADLVIAFCDGLEIPSWTLEYQPVLPQVWVVSTFVSFPYLIL